MPTHPLKPFYKEALDGILPSEARWLYFYSGSAGSLLFPAGQAYRARRRPSFSELHPLTECRSPLIDLQVEAEPQVTKQTRNAWILASFAPHSERHPVIFPVAGIPGPVYSFIGGRTLRRQRPRALPQMAQETPNTAVCRGGLPTTGCWTFPSQAVVAKLRRHRAFASALLGPSRSVRRHLVTKRPSWERE